MTNMTTDDVLEELAGYGSVELRKNCFPAGASPQLRGRATVWALRITLPGYSSPWATQSHVEVQGPSISDVAQRAYSELENFILVGRGTEDRERYEKGISDFATRARDPGWRRLHDGRFEHPEAGIPPIVWGKRRGGFIR